MAGTDGYTIEDPDDKYSIEDAPSKTQETLGLVSPIGLNASASPKAAVPVPGDTQGAVPRNLTRPSLPGTSLKYTGPESVALSPAERESRLLPLKAAEIAAPAAIMSEGIAAAPIASAIGLGTGYVGSSVGGPIGSRVGGMIGGLTGNKEKGAEIGRTVGEWGGGLIGGGLGAAGWESDIGQGIGRNLLSKVSPELAERYFPPRYAPPVSLTQSPNYAKIQAARTLARRGAMAEMAPAAETAPPGTPRASSNLADVAVIPEGRTGAPGKVGGEGFSIKRGELMRQGQSGMPGRSAVIQRLRPTVLIPNEAGGYEGRAPMGLDVAGPTPEPTESPVAGPRPPEEVFVRPRPSSRFVPGGGAVRLPPELHADLEAQAGRALSDAEANSLNRANLERGMTENLGGPNETEAIRQQNKAEMEKPDTERYKKKDRK